MCLCAQSLQLYPTLCDPLDYSPPSSSVHGILQVRILEWVAMPFSKGSSQPRDRIQVSCVFCIAGSFFEDKKWFKLTLGKQLQRWWLCSYKMSSDKGRNGNWCVIRNVAPFWSAAMIGPMAFSLMQLCYCRFNPLPVDLQVVVCWGQSTVTFSRILQFGCSTQPLCKL